MMIRVLDGMHTGGDDRGLNILTLQSKERTALLWPRDRPEVSSNRAPNEAQTHEH